MIDRWGIPLQEGVNDIPDYLGLELDEFFGAVLKDNQGRTQYVLTIPYFENYALDRALGGYILTYEPGEHPIITSPALPFIKGQGFEVVKKGRRATLESGALADWLAQGNDADEEYLKPVLDQLGLPL